MQQLSIQKSTLLQSLARFGSWASGPEIAPVDAAVARQVPVLIDDLAPRLREREAVCVGAQGTDMKRWFALLLPCLWMVAGCAVIDAREAGRAWQRHECLRQPSPDAQRSCQEAMREHLDTRAH